jgi:hypothetical protein
MSNKDTSTFKNLTKQQQQQEHNTIGIITKCLTERCDQCTGLYISTSKIGNEIYKLICHCDCHKERIKELRLKKAKNSTSNTNCDSKSSYKYAIQKMENKVEKNNTDLSSNSKIINKDHLTAAEIKRLNKIENSKLVRSIRESCPHYLISNAIEEARISHLIDDNSHYW